MTTKQQELYNDMTPKEKAQELYNKFYRIPIYVLNVKDCCHAIVDEMIEWIGDHTYMLGNKERGYHFWREVKEEINKL